jgi:hypothetical protein
VTWIALGRAAAGILRPRLLLFFWILSVLLGLVVALPFERTLAGATGALPDAGEAAARLGVPWWDDFGRAHAPTLAALGTAAGAVVWLHVLLGSLLVGGVIASFDSRAAARRRESGDRWDFGVFLADVGRQAGPMLRILLLGLPLFWLVDLAVNRGLATLFHDAFGDLENQRSEVLAEWLRQAILLVLVLLASTWLDLARARAVVGGRRSALAALADAASSAVSHPGPVAAVSLVFLAAELAVMGVGASVLASVRTDSWRELATWVVGAQVIVLLRLGLGFGRLAGYVAIAEEERADREARVPR